MGTTHNLASFCSSLPTKAPTVFGIESSVDFEKRIVAIYQQCRTPEQISFEFNQLQQELEGEISQARTEAREQLLNNFDQDVIERVRVASSDALGRFEDLLWRITRFLLAPYARFAADGHQFVVQRNPFPGETIHKAHTGWARPWKRPISTASAIRWRRRSSTAAVLWRRPLPGCFRYGDSGKRIAALQPLAGKAGSSAPGPR